MAITKFFLGVLAMVALAVLPSFGSSVIAYDGSACGVSKAGYLDFMEAAVRAYPNERLYSYCGECERDGVQEHGFPRLAANLAILVANGRFPGKLDLVRKGGTYAWDNF